MKTKTKNAHRITTLCLLMASAGVASPALALNGATPRMNFYNGWDGFEIITQGDNPTGSWSMPGTFDGIGAQAYGNTFRIQVSHETGDATVSEVLLDLNNFKSAINNVMTNGGGNTGGVSFVTSASQAYNRWSNDGGATWTNTTDTSNTSFFRFCSSQSFLPNTFGPDRGFVDDIYITGEEGGTQRLFALDINNRDFYQLSGVTGSAPGGIGGIRLDSWENAALIDTGETEHVALMLSPDGGTARMQLYIGEKGKDVNGNPSNDFLARNGLAYGSYYYFGGSLPGTVGATNNGGFQTSTSGALASSKLEDIDTNPSDPTKVALGDQDSGTFIFDLSLDFSGGSFNAAGSSFALTKIDDQAGNLDVLNNADNIDWAGATTLNGTSFPGGLIFVNEDNSSGEVWMMNPDGSGQIKIASTTVGAESSGILDVSELLGYNPGSILLTDNQGGPSSMTVLINPDATPVPEPTSLALMGLGGLLVARRRR